MNALLLRNEIRRASSLQSFKEYRASELQAGAAAASVTSDGTLLEFETLELRLHPPNVVIDNDSYDDMTVITIDSANRPGTLIEVVQCLTELNLSIRKARISSDGGWFVDEFFVTETPKGKVLHQHKLETIRKVLSVGSDASLASDVAAVFELSGKDQRGLLANVLSTLTAHQCEVHSCAVWTYHNQVALVVAVTDRQQHHHQLLHPSRLSQMGPPHGATGSHGSIITATHNRAHASSMGGLLGLEPDPGKMQNLAQVLVGMLGGEGSAHVAWEVVQGDIHHERRLHHLLLQEEERSWETQQVLSNAPSLTSHTSLPGASTLLGHNSSAVNSTNPPTPTHAGSGASPHQQLRSTATSGGGAPTAVAGNGFAQMQQPTSPTVSGGGGPHLAGGAANGSALGRPPGSSTDGNQQQRSPRAGGAGEDACVNDTASLAGSETGAPSGTQRQSSFASLQQQQLQLQEQGDEFAVDPSRHVHAQRAVQQGAPSTSGNLSTFPSGSQGFAPAPTAMASDLQGYIYVDQPEVRIQHSPLLKYHLVTIYCRDRNKLFFDTVCTLADMQYDVYHGAIDSEGEMANQLFYVRPRSGEHVLDDTKVRQLVYMLQCAVQRRFPKGLRVHMQASERHTMPAIFSALSTAGMSITRAEVRSLPDGRAILDLVLMDTTSGQVPTPLAVQRACEAAGGVAADELHPLMAVAGVGGAAAAAATGLARAGMYPHAASGANHLPPAAAHASHSVSGLPLPPGRAHLHHLPPALQHTQYLPSALGPAARAAAKFQFAISSSAERSKRGPLGHAASAASFTGGVGGVTGPGSLL